MSKVSILDFRDYRDFLVWARRQPLTLSKRPLTYVNWAKRLGYRSPRIVSMVFKGQRLPSGEMIEGLGRILGLSRDELRYFNLLVRVEKQKRKGRDVRSLLLDLEDLSPSQRDQFILDMGTFSYIAEWFYIPIRQLVGTRGFRNQAQWIRSRLRQKVTVTEVTQAIEAMLKLGLIRKKTGSATLEPGCDAFHTQTDVPSAAIRLHHAQMLDRAKEALVEQAVQEREFTSLTLRFDAARVEEAKQEIRKFKARFDRQFMSERGDQVRQLNIQFFEHTIGQEIEKGDTC